MPRTLTLKVTVATVAFLGLLTLVAVIVIASINMVDRATDHVTQQGIDYLNANAAFHEDLELIATNTEFFVLTAHQESREEIQEALGEAKDALPMLAIMGGTPSARFQPEFARLHETRVRVMTELEPVAGAVVQAVDRKDTVATARVLAAFARLNDQIDQLENDSDALIERELAAATSTIDHLTQRGRYSAVGGLGITAGAGLLLVLLLAKRLVQPLKMLSAASRAIAGSNLFTTVPVTHDDEIGDLQRAFNQMTAEVRERTVLLAAQVKQAESAQMTAEAAQAEVTNQLATITAQQQVIREMSVPVLPVNDDTLVLPLIGALDSTRLELFQATVLRAVESTRARHLLIDVTGVLVIDTFVARGLGHVVQAARLLGTQVMLVGVRPDVAQAMVAAGISLGSVTTHASLQDGIVATRIQGRSQTVDSTHILARPQVDIGGEPSAAFRPSIGTPARGPASLARNVG